MACKSKASNHKPKSFFEWLSRQRHRDTLVGDLARDAADDRTFPRGELTRDELLAHLRRVYACSEALDAAKAAWRSFSAYQRRATP